MKNLKILALAALVAFAACDEEEGPVDLTPVQPGTVVVTVNGGGAAVAGITVTLGAAGSTPQSTNATGQATFASVPVGNYVVSISGVPVDFVCPSTTQPVTVAANQTTSVRFDCNLVQTASVSGTVTNTTGSARAGANIVITRTLPTPAAAAVTVTTDAAGRYSLTGLRSGTYTVQLPVTTGCTTAANTQTVVIAAGEARSVNFQCTVVVPPPTGAQASGSIESITFTGPFGQISNVPDNEVQGSVTVNAMINEGDQRVTKVDLLLCNDAQTVCTVVGTQSYAQAASPAEKAVFPISFAVNTMAFNTTTGVPNFLNTSAGGPSRFVLRIYTVAGGSTTAAASVSRLIALVNIDAFYGRLSSQRTALSTDASAVGAGVMFHNGDITITALPIMYSGLTLQNVMISFIGDIPDGGGTDIDDYFGVTVDDGILTRTTTFRDTSAPYQVAFLAAVGAGDSDCLTSASDCGSGGLEDLTPGVNITSLRSDGQAGPGTGGTIGIALCTDGSVANFILFPFSQGCQNGQFATPFRIDNRPPTVDQLDRMIRTLLQFAFPPRGFDGACDALVDGVTGPSPSDKSNDCNGVSGWIAPTHVFSATRLRSGQTSTASNAILPRVADLGVGLPGSASSAGTAFYAYRAGSAAPTSGTTAAASYGSALTNGAALGSQLAASVNDRTYFINFWAYDVFGAAGAASNQRVRWYNNTPGGTGTSGGNITTLINNTNGRMMFGVNDMVPCFTRDGLACSDVYNGELQATGQIIGTAGGFTSAPGGSVGGVFDGSALNFQVLSQSNSAGGSPGFPQGPAIMRIRRLAPSSADLSAAGTTSTGGCLVGFSSGGNNPSCQPAGEGTSTGTNGSPAVRPFRQSGLMDGCFDFLLGTCGIGAADFRTVDVLTGAAVTQTRAVLTGGGCPIGAAYSTVGGCGDGYFVVDRRAVDNSYLKSATSTLTFVLDRTPPVGQGGVSHSFTVAPGGQVTVQTAAQDALELNFSDFYQFFTGTGIAIRRSRTQIGTFGPASYDTGPIAIVAGPFDWFSNLQLGGGMDAAGDNASGGLFRISDMGWNFAHQPMTSFPIVSPARTVATGPAGTLGLAVTNQIICWDTGGAVCGNPTSTTLVFTMTGQPVNPFVRVEFAVARDANNDGTPDTDGAGNMLYHLLGPASVSVVGTTYTYSRSVSSADLGMTADRSRTFDPFGPANTVRIRAFGVRANGTVVTLTGELNGDCPIHPAAVNSSCNIQLQGS